MQDNTHFVDTAKVASYPKGFNNVIFLDEVVSDSSYYRSAILTLKSAAPDDSIEIIFNTEGGASFTASVFVAAMRQCQARITGNLSGLCASAGTMIALNCDDWIIGDDLAFMVHSNSYGSYNSAEKIRDHMQFMDKWNSDSLRRDYEGFLSEDELVAMIESGKEYWFDATETTKRLKEYQSFHETKHNQALEDSFTQQFAEEDAMVEEALAALNIPVAEREVFDSISSKLEEYFSQQDGSPCAAPKQPCHEEEETSQTIDIQSVVDKLSAIEKEQCVDVFDAQGEPFGTLFYRYDEEDELVELEFLNNADELVVISHYALQDYDQSTLYRMCKRLGVSAVHNTGKSKLIDKVVAYFEELV